MIATSSPSASGVARPLEPVDGLAVDVDGDVLMHLATARCARAPSARRRPRSSSSSRPPTSRRAHVDAVAIGRRPPERRRDVHGHRHLDLPEIFIRGSGTARRCPAGSSPRSARGASRRPPCRPRTRRRRPRSRPAVPPRAPGAATTPPRPRRVTDDDAVDDVAVEDAGHERGADAVDAVRAGTAPRTAPATWPARPPTICTPGSLAFRTSPTPVMVPPVPTPATNASRRPSTASRISSAVVRRWTSGFAGFWNCCGMKYSGCWRTSSSAAKTAPLIPSMAGVRWISAPKRAKQPLALDAHVLRHREDQPVALHRRRPSPARCRCCRWSAPRCVAPGLSTPRRSASSTIATAIRSFTLPPGLRDSTLASDARARRRRPAAAAAPVACHRSGPAPSSRSCQP